MKSILGYSFLKINVQIYERNTTFSIYSFKELINTSIKQLHGQIGLATLGPVDIIKYDRENCEAILRIKTTCVPQVWSALTLVSVHERIPCTCTVLQVSPHLVALSSSVSETT